jgi:hypothetical protein
MDVWLHERLITVSELTIVSAVLPDCPEIEYGRIEQRAPSRGAVNETRTIGQPREALEPVATRNLARLAARGGYDLEAVSESEAVALKCQQAIVW